MDREDHAQLLAALAQELSHSSTEADTAAAVTDRALEYVPQADSVSITLRVRQTGYRTLAASDDLAQRLDDLQYALGEGPCVSVADGSDWHRSGDVGHDGRWPQWGPRAHALGIGSLLSVRLLRDGSPLGALNLYAKELGQFDSREEVDFALLYATHAALALTARGKVEGLETAMMSRHMIGMAQGLLIERFALDPERSFALLKRLSSVTNTKLSVVAAELVRTGKLPALVDDSLPTVAVEPPD